MITPHNINSVLNYLNTLPLDGNNRVVIEKRYIFEQNEMSDPYRVVVKAKLVGKKR